VQVHHSGSRGHCFTKKSETAWCGIKKKKNPGNHIVGFLKNLFVNYGGK